MELCELLRVIIMKLMYKNEKLFFYDKNKMIDRLTFLKICKTLSDHKSVNLNVKFTFTFQLSNYHICNNLICMNMKFMMNKKNLFIPLPFLRDKYKEKKIKVEL